MPVRCVDARVGSARRQRLNIRRILFSLIAAVTGVSTIVGGAAAQTPSSAGGLACAAGPFNTQAGQTVDISTVLREADGNALGGGLIFYSIVSQVGSDASLSAPSATTGDTGAAFASLSSGSTAGPVLIRAMTEDGQQCLTNVEVVAAVPRGSAPDASSSSDRFRGLGLVGMAAGIFLVGLRGLQTAGPQHPSRA